MTHRWCRREFLRGLGLGTALLPTLIAEREAQADDKTAPRRLVVLSVPNGVRPEAYWPTGTEKEFVIPTDGEMPASQKFSPLAPLIPHKKDIIFLGGIDIQNGTDCTESGLSGHQVLPFMLTGTVGGECPVNPDDVGRQATGPSVDRFIGKELRKRHNLRFDSLVIKATERTHTSFNDGYLSFDGPPIGGLPNAPSQIVSPVALYDELFGDGNMTAAELANLRLRRKSILDLVGSDLERFRKNLGKEDRARIEQHLTSIRSVEQQLEVENLCGGVNLEELGLSRTTNYLNPNGNPHMHKAMRAQTELTVLGLACDATRVASLLWPESTGTFTVFHWLGSDFIVPGDPEVFADQGNNKGLLSHHELAHLEAGKEEYQPLVNRACQWYMEEFAYLIQRLAETDDVDGKRMLDNSAALFTNMQRTGAGHEVFDLPWVLAGSCGGYFETGRFLPWPSGTANQGAPQNGVLAALCNAMGVPVDHFGAADYGGEMTVLKG